MTVLRVIDFETSGMEPPAAQVVEVGYCDLTRNDDGVWSVGQPVSWLCGVPAMRPEVRAVHHISLAEVAGLAPFDPSTVLAPHGAAVRGHHRAFEAAFLGDQQSAAICTLKAAHTFWPDAPSHSNSVPRHWLEDQGLLSLDHDT